MGDPEPNGRLFTVGEVASFLRVTKRTIQRELLNGSLAGFRVRKQWRITSENLNAYILNHSLNVVSASNYLPTVHVNKKTLPSIASTKQGTEPTAAQREES